jgi:hypothetical protein
MIVCPVLFYCPFVLARGTIGASLALADSGIEMYDLVAACSVARSGAQEFPASILSNRFARHWAKKTNSFCDVCLESPR